jgi:hypothetical protein
VTYILYHFIQFPLNELNFLFILHTFTNLLIRKVADFLGTKHYEFTFTLQDGLDALKKLIWHLESYDVTTIRYIEIIIISTNFITTNHLSKFFFSHPLFLSTLFLNNFTQSTEAR